MSDTLHPPASAAVPESYIVSEGKKRGSTREVRAEAAHDRFYKILQVHAGDAILTDNWHTNEVLSHLRDNFAGQTFAMRTLEARGALVESDRRAIYTAGGRVWVFDLEPSAGEKERLPGASFGTK
jgi:predicted nucleotidyltransferase